MVWTSEGSEEYKAWFDGLPAADRKLIVAAVELLEERGPALGRPLVDTIVASDYKNMKELRPGSSGTSEIRILFIFDPTRKAILLMGGNKTGRWKQWYESHTCGGRDLPQSPGNAEEGVKGWHHSQLDERSRAEAKEETMIPTAEIHKATRELPGAEAEIAALKAGMIQRLDAEARQPKPVRARLRDTVRHLVPTRARTH